MPPLSAEGAAALKERQQERTDATKAAPLELRPTDAERDPAAEAHRHEEAAEVAAAAFEANTGIHISNGGAAPHGDEAKAEKEAAGKGGGAKGTNRCPHGTGGVTKFDLLHPAGRCLWIVKAEEKGQERKNNASSASSSGSRVKSTADQGDLGEEQRLYRDTSGAALLLPCCFPAAALIRVASLPLPLFHSRGRTSGGKETGGRGKETGGGGASRHDERAFGGRDQRGQPQEHEA